MTRDDLLTEILWLLENGMLNGMEIRRLLREGGNDLSIGYLYALMEFLEKLDYVTAEDRDPTPERGNRPKRYWWLTDAGRDQCRKRRLARCRGMALVTV